MPLLFRSRGFRVDSRPLNKRVGIKSPADLNGRRVGVQTWFTTTALWMRGILQDERTGFFPIMHTLLIKTDVLNENPWVAMSLFDAWQASKQRCYKWLEWQRIHQTSMWFRALWEEERGVAGSDIYPWGFRKTRAEVDKMLDYAHRQGLTSCRFEPEEMFHPSTLDT
ncbi:MAG: hypothetical protein ACE5JU_13420 [Candidatus Binatia bacterium]